jgi:hypothetical protein
MVDFSLILTNVHHTTEHITYTSHIIFFSLFFQCELHSDPVGHRPLQEPTGRKPSNLQLQSIFVLLFFIIHIGKAIIVLFLYTNLNRGKLCFQKSRFGIFNRKQKM